MKQSNTTTKPMENQNQSAVEWLMDKLPTIDKYDPYYEDIIQQAKAMEKEQIIEAYEQGESEWTPFEFKTAQDYYTSSYGK
jgi:hypothetical protein